MDATTVVRALSALAQETRLLVYRELVRAGREGLAAGVIRDRVGIPGTTLSFHLAQLSQAGLTTVRREGRSLLYSADVAAMQSLLGFLSENCCQDACPTPPARSSSSRKKA